MTAAPHLQLVTEDRGYLEVATALVRRFLLIGENEPVELTFFNEGRISVAYATGSDHHARLLREGERRHGFNGAYQLVNGPIDPALLYRYEPNEIAKAWNGRATDRDIATRRAVFLDIDPVRPKGISATDEQLLEAQDVADHVQEFLAGIVGANAIGRGCSGNGVFLLVALEPRPVDPSDVGRISAFLKALHGSFGTAGVKIDSAVANPARLMPAPGTWKRKGRNAPERPHRQTSFSCRGQVDRVPLESLLR